MIRVEVIEKFSLEKYNELENIKRVKQDKTDTFNINDTFECTEKMCKYLTGENDKGKKVVKIIEVVPE